MKTYRINLEVLTAVHIGNGNRLTKKDFQLQKEQVNIYNPLKLHSILGRSYEDFLLSNYTLTDFLTRNRKNVSQALEYSLESKETSIRKSDNIDEFIKDPRGFPYIPGSSLKGAIRTAILSYLVKENKDNKYSNFINQRIDRNNAARIEELAFGSIRENAFRQVKISDSQPLSKKDLILCKKVDVFQDENTNTLNISRESLRLGTKVEFVLTLDDSLSKEVQPFTIDFILKAIDESYALYSMEYLKKFSSFDNAYYNERIIYLGGGTGFLTKTINQPLYGNKTTYQVANCLDTKFKRHNHKKDIALGISPRALKCTLLNGKTEEMGICSIRID